MENAEDLPAEDQTPLPVLKDKSEEALDEFFLQLQDFITKHNVPGNEQMELLEYCVKKSGYKMSDFNVVSDEQDISDFNVVSGKQVISDVFSTMKKFVSRENYLKANRAIVEKKLKSVRDGWFQKQGYSLNGIAFPLILKLHEGYLPIFLTCAHCACRRDEKFKSKILLTPSDSLDPDKSFIFELENDNMIFRRDAELDEDGHTLDFIALSLKGKKDRNGNDSVKHFWMATTRNIKKGDKVFMATTHENCQTVSVDETVTANIPYVAEGVIGEVLKSVALHDIVGISGLSGECMYAPGEANNEFECLLMFRGGKFPDYIGVPIASIKEHIEQFGKELERFCFKEIPDDFITEGFVKSYLVLLSDNDGSNLSRIDGAVCHSGSVGDREENTCGSENMEQSGLPAPEESDDLDKECPVKSQ